MTNDPTQAIYDAFERWRMAWNNGDIDGYLVGYWESEKTRYISNGKIFQGKAAISESYKSRFAGSADLGQLEITQFEVELLGRSDAIVFGIFHLTLNDTSSTGAFTVHLRNFEGEWLIVLDHSSG